MVYPTGRTLTYRVVRESCLTVRVWLQKSLFSYHSVVPFSKMYRVLWISILFPMTLYHSFLYLHIVFPEKVRTSCWVILAVFSSVPLSPSVPSSDNIFRITDAHQVIIKPFVRPHFPDTFFFLTLTACPMLKQTPFVSNPFLSIATQKSYLYI